MEADWQAPPDLAALTTNEFDVPATLVPERETELHNLLHSPARAAGARRSATTPTAGSSGSKTRFTDVFPLVRPHLHGELRKYLILRTLKKDLKDTVFGFGPLQDLLRAPTISEIMVVAARPDLRRARRRDRAVRPAVHLRQGDRVDHRADRGPGRPPHRQKPAAGRCPPARRLAASTRSSRRWPSSGPCLTIRKFPRAAVHDGRPDRARLDHRGRPPTFLRACVIDDRNILVSGGTGTGKTTLLNVLSAASSRTRSGSSPSRTRPNCSCTRSTSSRLESKPPNVEGTGAYTIRDLVKNALRMRPDRIIVGECRGAEALDMLQAMNTGHDGSMTTVHANSADEVIAAAGSAGADGGRPAGQRRSTARSPRPST